jgi:hypothetical protein
VYIEEFNSSPKSILLIGPDSRADARPEANIAGCEQPKDVT